MNGIAVPAARQQQQPKRRGKKQQQTITSLTRSFFVPSFVRDRLKWSSRS
jgi:hypothetical protein